MPMDDSNADPIRLMVTYDPILDNIHDKLAGTTTIYKEEYLRDPLTNQPITNSAGRPITFLKQTAIPKDGVSAITNGDGVEFCMGALNAVVNRATTFADMSLSDIVYEANSTVSALNDNITINSQKYGINNLAAWFSMTKIIRNFLFNYLSAVKNGGMRDWSASVLGVGYDINTGTGNSRPMRQQGIIERLFARKGMTDADGNFRG